MKWGYQNKKRLLAATMFGFIMVTGTYNAVVINSESTISSADVKFVKRLDEVYGVVTPGREYASSIRWEKLKAHKVVNLNKIKKLIPLKKSIPTSVAASAGNAGKTPEIIVQPAVQEELNLSLTEAMNPKLFPQGIKDFGGSLSTRDGIIEELSISLPGQESISVAFSGMTGNVFEYDYDGQVQTAMMYQVDQNIYKVNLTSGKLEGTILTFKAEETVEQIAIREQHDMQQQQNREEIALAYGQPSEQEQPQAQEVPPLQEMPTDPHLQNPDMQNAFMQDQIATQAAMNEAQGSNEQDPNMQQNYGAFQGQFAEGDQTQQQM